MKLEFDSTPATVPFAGSETANGINAENRPLQISEMLQEGVRAAQTGNRAAARSLLLQVTEADPRNENAWLWMASISEYPEELLVFLNNVLAINPNNARALEWSHQTKSMLAKNFVQRGVDASNETNMDLAKQCFLQAIVHDAQNEMAWLWLASISDSTEEKIAHLQKVLSINPKNETAHASLQAAKNQVAESLLQKANRAAISGERDKAAQMLEEILKNAPELEEALILKSYLADSFSEKITCYEKVLAINPDNDAANAGMAALKAMMAKNAKPNTARLDVIVNERKENQSGALMNAQNSAEAVEHPAETIAVEKNQASNFDSIERTADYQPNAVEMKTEAFRLSDYAPQNFAAVMTPREETAPQQSSFETNYAGEQSTVNNYNAPKFESAAEKSEEKTFAKTAGNYSEEKPLRSTSELLACPFCGGANESNAFVCSSCRAVLTLSDLEMLLASNEADTEILRQTVGQMEAERTERDFEAQELKTLAIGHINLKNLRQGILLLQAALRMNPNDVMLGSQVNSLKIRLAEIEHQQTNSSLMTKGKTIMVVDDSATVRKLISSKLEKVGHEVICAIDGVDALEKIKGIVPDLILLDINMPRMDGYQVCKSIRTEEATKDVPVVMISGNDGFFDKVRGRMSGTTGYITKPFGPEALMKMVESYII